MRQESGQGDPVVVIRANHDRMALTGVLLLALLIRVWVIWSQTYVVFFDETFQYLEQGHRLAFGTGVLPWEFQDGIRSWLLPGMIAGLMDLERLVTGDPLLMIRLIRLCCAVLSLSVVYAGYRLARQRDGGVAAVLTGGICAVWFDLIWFAPAVLTEVLAAHLAVLAIALGEARQRRPLAIGALFGLAFCLRYQYAPALLAAMLWQYRLRWADWRWLLTGVLAVVVPVGGLLDWLTWGSPFQSIWLNVLRNSVQGVSASIGTEGPQFYLDYLNVALWPLPVVAVLAVLAVAGAWRAPALGLAALVTLLLHSAIPHKEVRFVYLAVAVLPILLGLGTASLIRGVAGRVVALGLAGALSFHLATSEPLALRWQFLRAPMLAFLAAHDEPALCGLAVRDVPLVQTGGYTWLHRDVPLYVEGFDPAIRLAGASVVLRMNVIRHRNPVPQPGADGLAPMIGHFSHMIAAKGHGEPGFTRVACFTDATRGDQPPLCLFSRAGGCS